MILFKTKVAAATGHRLAQLVVALAPVLLTAPATAQLDRATTQQTQADQRAAQSQTTINQIRDQTADSATKYAQAVAEAESLERFNAQLSEQVRSQQTEISSIEKQLTDIETTNREVSPLMQQMVDTLEQFVRLDVPFLIEERSNRVQELKSMMERADIPISEKYRKILEAYQIELDYGRTLDAYDGRLPGTDGQFRTVEFVRLGRISLMYRTLDGSETGYWDQSQKKWVKDPNYAESIEEALRIARKKGAPELLTVPVPAPQEVRS